jgi:hypothetical protein
MEGRRLAQRAVWSRTARFSKTARSGALRGGLIEGHTGVRQTRMLIVRNWDGRSTRAAATTRQGQSGAPFFRADDKARGARCRPSDASRAPSPSRCSVVSVPGGFSCCGTLYSKRASGTESLGDTTSFANHSSQDSESLSNALHGRDGVSRSEPFGVRPLDSQKRRGAGRFAAV